MPVLVVAVCFRPVLDCVWLFHVLFFRLGMRKSLGTISLLFGQNFEVYVDPRLGLYCFRELGRVKPKVRGRLVVGLY